MARHLEVLALFALPKKNSEGEEEAFGFDRAQISENASQGLSDGSLGFSNSSESGDSVDYDDRSSEPLLKLMKDLPNEEPSILPEGFLLTFEERL